MGNTETWGIVLRDHAGEERWIACEVTRDRGRFRAKSVAGDDGMSYAFDVAAVEAHARWIERTDATVAHARCVTREAYAAHTDGVRRVLVADEVAQLRASIINREEVIGELRASEASAFRRGAEAMREAAVRVCKMRSALMMSAAGQISADSCAEAIRAIPLPTEATPPPAQSHEAPATLDAPLTIADAAARARGAAAQRTR